MLQVLSRHQINSSAWDASVAASSQRILYGYSWYLDAVLPGPDWKWVGIVNVDINGQYQAVMPIPLRRKRVAGIAYHWVVHQPFFCQFLNIFSRDESVDTVPFFQLMQQEFRYGSMFSIRKSFVNQLSFSTFQTQTTHVLDLLIGYERISQRYSHDRASNLRRAHLANWTIIDSTDPEPLLTLFRKYQANGIDGGVADWAYDIFRNLVAELNKRNLVVLRYATREHRIEAGALFVQEGDRIIYLFNAASEAGRQGNARTLLIDQMIRKKAGDALIFDFESPEKPSIRDFYRSFGAFEEPFYTVRWNRLSVVENIARKVVNVVRGR
ncbi:GNAT family N-acetyltransferase [Spirosoma jeollabukense]